MSRFRSIDLQTEYLLPPSVQDWMPESHLARYMVDVVEGLDLSALECNQPDQRLVDSGFFSEHNVERCHDAGIELLIAVGHDEHHPDWRSRFEEPALLERPAMHVEQRKHALKTRAGRAVYAPRIQTVEPVFGVIKSVMGFRQILLCGLNNVRNE